MKKVLALLLTLLFIIPAICSCGEDPADTSKVTEPENTQPVSPEDNYAGTPAYTVNGDKIIVDGVEYPNDKVMTSGNTYAIDDLGRDINENKRQGYTTDGSRQVGMFYFLWNGKVRDEGIFDMTEIVKEGGEAAKNPNYEGWGSLDYVHFWGKPLYGYYYSSDEWVIRKHIEMLTYAGVDFLFFDATNANPYLDNAMKVMTVIHEYIENGYNPPKIVFYTHTNSAMVFRTLNVAIYERETLSDTWYYYDGKPLIIADEAACRSAVPGAADNYTFREPQWPNEEQKVNGWPWMDFKYPQKVYKNKEGNREVVNVSVAQHCGTVCFSDSAFYGDLTNHGRSYHNGANDLSEGATMYGYNFQEQWDRAIATKVPVILVTGWNEWTAQRQTDFQGKIRFVDNASMEFSRDIEPMSGGYFDNYYMQLIDNIRRYKGSAPELVQDTRKAIDINGSFDQWNDILVSYADPTGDCADRNNLGFAHMTITDGTGNNDIAAAKITHDTKNMYFYVETVDAISEPVEGTSWMQLFINADMNADTGFYGFDYILNYDGAPALAKSTSNGKEFSFEKTADIAYRKEGNKMMIRVSLSDLGITDYHNIRFAFKWVDSDTRVTTMEQMYSEGDCAPLGRLCYVFQNCK